MNGTNTTPQKPSLICHDQFLELLESKKSHEEPSDEKLLAMLNNKIQE